MWITFRVGPCVGMASALVLTGCGILSGTPELSTSLTTGSAGATVADAAAAMAVINEAYAAFNFGDVQRWVAMRDPGSYHESEEGRKSALEESTLLTESQVVAGAQFTRIQCWSHGEGEWPGVADGGVPTAEGHFVTCDTFLAPESVNGGGEMQFKWVIADGEVVAVTSEWSAPGWARLDDTADGDAEPAQSTDWRAVRQRVSTLQGAFRQTQ